MQRLVILVLVATMTVLAGCTQGTTPTPTDVASTIAGPLPETMSASPIASEVAPSPDPACGVTKKRTELLARDWDRVVNSLGRPDQADFTSSLVTRLSKLEKSAAECARPDLFERMVELAKRIDKSARVGSEDLDSINEFRKTGNSWLVALGYEPSLIS